MTHVMIDLETLGTSENAAIISIGAVEFNPETGIMGRTFYERIDWASAMKGRSVDADTIKWWMQQSDEARLEVIKPGKHITTVLNEFRAWLPHKNECVVWGNGATFDITLLTTAYKGNTPWQFRNVRDMRTIKMFGAISDGDVTYQGVVHNALDDAIWQAEYVSKAYRKLKGIK